MEASKSMTRPIVLPCIAGTTIILGALIGASTNAINGAVSPAYFRNVMRWNDIEDIWRAAIAQGILEGLIFSTFFALIFTLVVGIVSRARCSFVYAVRYLLAIVFAISSCWIIGGLLAMGLAILSPDFYRSSFYGVPDAFEAMLGYAWVGGSIWGELFGGLLSVAIGSVWFSVRWNNPVVDCGNTI